jgi:hypothetical protein
MATSATTELVSNEDVVGEEPPLVDTTATGSSENETVFRLNIANVSCKTEKKRNKK